MPRFKTLGRELDFTFGDNINENFTKTDEELTRIEGERKTRDDELQNDINSKNSAAHARMTQIEQDGITRNTEHKNSSSAHPAENITYKGPINALTAKAALEWLYTQINNIVANAGKDNTEIVDGRLGADGIARATIGLLLREIHKEQLAANKQTVTIGHGISIINASGNTSSPAKVEFYGQTLVNILGIHKTVKTLSSVALGTNLYLNGEGSIDTGASLKKVRLEAGKYYLLVVNWDIATNNNINILRAYNGSVITDGTQLGTVINNSNMTYCKFTVANSDSVRLGLRNNVDGSNYNFKSAILVEVKADTYNKIGVTLLDADIEKMFPYVDSVQSVKNPVLLAEGENLLPPFSQWILHANAKVISPYELELNATGSGQTAEYDVKVIVGQQYTLSVEKNSTSARFIAYFKRSDGTTISDTGSIYTRNNVTFVVPNGTDYVRVRVDSGTSTGTFTFKQPMLNVGSTAKPFVPRNPSYLYAETTLAGNDNKKDICRDINYEIGKAKLERWFERKEALTVTNAVATLSQKATANTCEIEDETTGAVYYRVATLSGTGNEFTQGGTDNKTITFNATNVPTTPKATYQRVAPVFEDVRVYGDLKVNGATQVSVGSEFTYTEDEEGKRTYTITPANQRTGANLTQVNVEYNQNIKTVVDDLVNEKTDMKTDMTVFATQLLKVFARLEELEGGV